MDNEKEQKTKRAFKETCKSETNQIALRLKEVRKEHHLSQEEMADKIKVSRSYICALEHGEYTIPAYVVKQYCDAFHMTADAFLRTEEDYRAIKTESGRRLSDELPFMSEEDADDVLAFYELLKKRESK